MIGLGCCTPGIQPAASGTVYNSSRDDRAALSRAEANAEAKNWYNDRGTTFAGTVSSWFVL